MQAAIKAAKRRVRTLDARYAGFGSILQNRGKLKRKTYRLAFTFQQLNAPQTLTVCPET